MALPFRLRCRLILAATVPLLLENGQRGCELPALTSNHPPRIGRERARRVRRGGRWGGLRPWHGRGRNRRTSSGTAPALSPPASPPSAGSARSCRLARPATL